jgi:hypothetical protein
MQIMTSNFRLKSSFFISPLTNSTSGTFSLAIFSISLLISTPRISKSFFKKMACLPVPHAISRSSLLSLFYVCKRPILQIQPLFHGLISHRSGHSTLQNYCRAVLLSFSTPDLKKVKLIKKDF